jgi:hypothetical protein
MKKRRNFNALAIFQRYYHGNVQCIIFKSGIANGITNQNNNEIINHNREDKSFEENLTKIITLPIFYTRYVAKDIFHIPNHIENYFE